MPQLPFTFRGAGRPEKGSTEDPSEAATSPSPQGPPRAPPSAAGRVERLSVSDLAQALRRRLETEFRRVLVEGEVRGLRVQPSSGHAYFDLADRRARVPVFMSARRLHPEPPNLPLYQYPAKLRFETPSKSLSQVA
ncbi:MAG: exodeoxyribonuclease VII large subunit, partial [Myxococcota bacterium]